jgi:hypothetical protein
MRENMGHTLITASAEESMVNEWQKPKRRAGSDRNESLNESRGEVNP